MNTYWHTAFILLFLVIATSQLIELLFYSQTQLDDIENTVKLFFALYLANTQITRLEQSNA